MYSNKRFSISEMQHLHLAVYVLPSIIVLGGRLMTGIWQCHQVMETKHFGEGALLVPRVSIYNKIAKKYVTKF